ncbi:MAG: hypothetical protein PHU21_04085 [Elusimicrobia bacterium]|nr:hypothetical protein [Elusimicrobiota bacterium]
MTTAERLRSRLLAPALVALISLCAALPARGAGERETIVFLHGMGRTRVSMAILAMRFQSAGYQTLSFPYSQKGSTLDEISTAMSVFLAKKVRTAHYHLVGHSLGNIVIRSALRRSLRPGLGRIVMLAPPNRPAQLARLLQENRLYRWLSGDSGQQIAQDGFYKTLPVPPVEFGVIAGDKGQKLTFAKPNDGVLEVEATKLPGMKDFVIVHHTHTWLMNSKDTFDLCRRFLESGAFRER